MTEKLYKSSIIMQKDKLKLLLVNDKFTVIEFWKNGGFSVREIIYF